MAEAIYGANMKIIKFNKWTRRRTNNHTPGFTQIINEHYINIYLFGFWWKKAVTWTEYIDEFHDD